MFNSTEVLQEGSCVLIPEDRHLLQAPLHDFLQGGGNVGTEGGSGPWPFVSDGVHRGLIIVASEGSRAGGNLIENDPQRPDIRKMADMIALQLLRRHVCNGA